MVRSRVWVLDGMAVECVCGLLGLSGSVVLAWRLGDAQVNGMERAAQQSNFVTALSAGCCQHSHRTS